MTVEIPRNRTFSFKVKIIHTKAKQILVGVVDRKVMRNAQYSHTVGEAVSYYGLNGNMFPSDEYQGGGFKTGDVVEAVVNLEAGKVDWKVQGKHRASLCHNQLKADASFVPYLTIHDEGDIVEWKGYH